MVLARLGIAESKFDLPSAQYYQDAIYAGWAVRMRAFMGWINYSTGTRSYPPIATRPPFTGSGTAGKTVSILDDLILSSTNPQSVVYQPFTAFNAVSNPTALTANMRYAFFPQTAFELEDLYTVYTQMQNMLGSNWSVYPAATKGRESWVGTQTTYVRGQNGDPNYSGLSVVQPNAANWFYDAKIVDNWFLIACVAQNKHLSAPSFPIPPLQLTAYPPDPNFDAVGPLPSCP